MLVNVNFREYSMQCWYMFVYAPYYLIKMKKALNKFNWSEALCSLVCMGHVCHDGFIGLIYFLCHMRIQHQQLQPLINDC